MPLQAILLVSLTHGLINLIAYTFGLRWVRYITLVWVLIAYFFILPPYFDPEMDEEKAKCGLPLFAITMGFWIFGTCAAIFTHIFSSTILWQLKKEAREEYEILDEEMD